jgi:hypothetical protein
MLTRSFCGCLGLADPVHLDDDHAFAADVGQVDEHQRASLEGTQPPAARL